MFSDCKGKVCAALINAPPRPTGSQHTLDVNQVTLQETSSYKPGAGPGPGAGPEPGQVQTLCSWWFNHAGAPMKIRTSCLTSRLVHQQGSNQQVSPLAGQSTSRARGSNQQVSLLGSGGLTSRLVYWARGSNQQVSLLGSGVLERYLVQHVCPLIRLETKRGGHTS